ncbi:efflux RND transporter periplasmic adaptor subunit [Rhodobacteraceae bacterium RKSG542]|uniref:efflux RND transporter periplasmic adaptor subunit n=1 Tax=Pseudovibrio flavus TaxID=2529854 RepID=UPI0012BBFC7B|nr:efflux RND transporter periplasmic adaptor subunit [Pseudovibrio flavus]MTI18197.1 efflux RND transporter periplasmic adaptor subunit [Pseudovibrio flavus]
MVQYRRALTALALAVAIPSSILHSPASAQSPTNAAAPGVLTEEVKLQTLDANHVFSGRTEALAQVSLIARVGGFLEPLQFVEGSFVKRGAPLFKIEQAPYEFAVAQAKANVESAQAQVNLAQLNYDRKKQLVEKDTISVSELDVVRANLKEANAALALREAELALRELDLSYTQVTAPMDGKVSTSPYREGAYVNSASGELATITSLDPIRVSFPISQGLMPNFYGADSAALSPYRLQLRLTDGSIYEHDGSLDHFSADANPATDSVTARAVFPNPDLHLFNKQLVDIIISRRDAPTEMIVSQAALLMDQSGTYVLKVNTDGVVEKAPVAIGRQSRGLVVIKSGLTEGDQVVVAGSQKARPGTKVNPTLVGHNQ